MLPAATPIVARNARRFIVGLRLSRRLWSCIDRSSPLYESLAVAEPWVTGVSDRVTEKVERQHYNGDGEAREDHQWPVGNKNIRDRATHHIAPGGRRRGNAYPQKAQGRLNDDGHAELCRDEHQIGRDTLRGDVLQDDPGMRRPKGRGGIDVGELFH